jgi:succinyl-CoA synthetase beta subunit
VWQGVVDAYKNMGDAIKVPIIVRLQGTNAAIAKELIDNSGMPILSAVEFKTADQVKAALLIKNIRYKILFAMANRIFCF